MRSVLVPSPLRNLSISYMTAQDPVLPCMVWHAAQAEAVILVATHHSSCVSCSAGYTPALCSENCACTACMNPSDVSQGVLMSAAWLLFAVWISCINLNLKQLSLCLSLSQCHPENLLSLDMCLKQTSMKCMPKLVIWRAEGRDCWRCICCLQDYRQAQQ